MSKSHEVMFFTDSRHTNTYLYEPPMDIRKYLEPIDEVADPNALGMSTKVNGEDRQSGVTGEMIINLNEMISEISKYITLYPGDIITPGTCAGTAFDSSRLLPEDQWQPGKLKVEPTLFLKDNDLVEGHIEGLGVLRNRMVAESRLHNIGNSLR